MDRRFSKQRQIIYKEIMRQDIHPSADTIYNNLKDEYPNLSLGTIYRNLNVLVDMGLIKKVVGDLDSEHYDGILTPHYHFICKKCKKIYNMQISEKINIVDEINDTTDHKIEDMNIVFNGICSECLKGL